MRMWMLRVIGLLIIFTAYLLLEEYVMQVHGTSLAGRLSPKDEKITARIDVSEKTANAAPCFRLIDKNTGKELSQAGWMPKWGSRGYVMQKNGNSADLQINVVADNCKIDISLKGPWELKDKNDRSKGLKEHWVEYTKFTVNGKSAIRQYTPAWHNKPIRHTITAQKGDTLNIAAKWQKYAG